MKLIKSTESKSCLLQEERKWRNQLFPHIFSFFSPVKDWNPLILVYKFNLYEWVLPGISLFLKYQFFKWKTESLRLSQSLTWVYVNTALTSCSLPCIFNKIWLIVTACLAKWHSFCFPKAILLLYSTIPHLPLTC